MSDNSDRNMKNAVHSSAHTFKKTHGIQEESESLVCSDKTWQLLHTCIMMFKNKYNNFFFFLYYCRSRLEHRASVERFVSLQFLNLRESVGLLWRGISPSQGRSLKHTQNEHRHPCLELDSNPRSECSRGRRYFMPQTEWPLSSALSLLSMNKCNDFLEFLNKASTVRYLFIFISTAYIIKFHIYMCSKVFFSFRVTFCFTNPDDLSLSPLPNYSGLARVYCTSIFIRRCDIQAYLHRSFLP
jgi:hypothetical protein